MTTAPLAHTDVIVLDYLAALWAQSEDLPPDLRDELMSTVADYVAMRRTAPSDPIDDAGEVIRRLGPPEALVAAARRGSLPPHLRLPALIPPPAPVLPARTASAQGGVTEFAAVGLIGVGAFVAPVVGPLAGVLLASGSSRWTPSQKATAWMLTAGAPGAGLVFGLMMAAVGFPAGPALVFLYLMLCATSATAGHMLLRALRTGPPQTH